MEIDTIEINKTKYLVKIHFENRKSCRVSIRKKIINIRIPSFLPREEKIKQLERMKSLGEEENNGKSRETQTRSAKRIQ